MKKLLKFLLILLIILGALGALAYFKGYNNLLNRWINFSFCESSVYYRVGSIDPEFAIDRETIVKNTKEAGNLWNDLIGRRLFIYDESADLTIDLVYDQRQSVLTEISQKKSEVDQKTDDFALSIEEFEQKRQALETKLNTLNQEIDYWNKKGGASEEKFEELTDRQNALRNEIVKINQVAEKLNRTSEKISEDVDYVNQKVETFNQMISVLPEEGVYITGAHKIEIYLYDTPQSFTHTVAHELGHALGLDHVDQEASIMYPISSPQSKATEADLNAISSFCLQQNRLDLIKNDLKNVWYTMLAELGFVVT